MRQMTEKLKIVATELTAKRGRFALFALIMREDAPDLWDLVVSADWLESAGHDGMRVVADAVQKKLSVEEVVTLSRVVVLPRRHALVKAVTSILHMTTGGDADLRNVRVNDFVIKDARVIIADQTALNGAIRSPKRRIA